MIIFRTASLADSAAAADVEAQSWPAGLAASEATWKCRIETFATGQWLAQLGPDVVGALCTQRLSARRFAECPMTYDALTDRGTLAHSHDPSGEVFQLVGVAALPAMQGFRVGRQLVDRAIELARGLPGVQHIVGFTRPARYHRHAKMPIEEYCSARNSSGRLLDPVLGFHLEAGARLVSIHAGFRPEDAESRGYGVLIEYDVGPSYDPGPEPASGA